ncbi:DUF6318 family protein [Isoptericola sp. NPDC056578]|uniref:DUF6318 family protein n=1 Tax=Isoptericola sp. NPDC056578 TaxID=3345870 RepID=UPI00368AAF60
MTRSRAILAATSIAAAAVLLVAGCDDDPPATPSAEPTATDVSPSASPSPSSSAVVVAPERPKKMDDDGPAGAEAAAVYFLELDDYIMKTGDTAEWEAMSGKACGFCDARLEQAQTIAKRGDRFEGGATRARALHTYEQDAVTGIWPVDVETREDPWTITDSNGEELASDKAVVAKSRVEVARRSSDWIVVGVINDQEN